MPKILGFVSFKTEAGKLGKAAEGGDLPYQVQDLLRFRIFSSFFDDDRNRKVWDNSFNTPLAEFDRLRADKEGVLLICRASQFVEYIKHLREVTSFCHTSPTMEVISSDYDAFDALAKMTGLTRIQAEKAALALGCENSEKLAKHMGIEGGYDVSKNPLK